MDKDESGVLLWQSCYKNDTQMVKDILQQCPNINKDIHHDTEQTTPLFEVCRKGNIECARILLNAGCNVNECDGMNGESPLYVACEKGHQELARLLINKGADKNHQTFSKRSCLHTAVSGKHEGLVKLLLMQGINVNLTNNAGNTALYLAVQYNLIGIAQMLVQHGADCNIVNKKGKTALGCAKDKPEILDILTTSKSRKSGCLETTGTSPACQGCQHQISSGESTSLPFMGHQNAPQITVGRSLSVQPNQASPCICLTKHSSEPKFNISVSVNYLAADSSRTNSGIQMVCCPDSNQSPIRQKLCQIWPNLTRKLDTLGDPEPHIDYLFSKNIISLEEKQSLESERETLKKTEKLMRILFQKTDKWEDCFIESLRQNGSTERLADELTGCDVPDGDYPKLCDCEEVKANVISNYQTLKENLDVFPHLAYLYQERILADFEREALQVERVRYNQATILVDTLLKKCCHFWVATFIDSLKKDPATKWLAETLTEFAKFQKFCRPNQKLVCTLK